MRTALLISLAGALGTLARYGLAAAVYSALGTAFPWGTLAVNVLGCLIFGAVMQAWGVNVLSDELRAVISIGFLGAFTTFSTFSYESLAHLQEGRAAVALCNIAVSVLLGLGACWLGVLAAKAIWGAA
jgi:CrcB protein